MHKAAKVLIVDDDHVFCQLLEKGLARLGYQPSTACDARAALAFSHTFDVILLDLRLGDESGLSLIRDLLEQYNTPKIIVITGYASLATAVNAIKRGACDYIAKPIDVDSVHKVISDCIDESKSTHHGIKEEQIPENPISLKRLEWEYIQRALDENKGNISQTAIQLGMHRRTLQRKLKKHAPHKC